MIRTRTIAQCALCLGLTAWTASAQRGAGKKQDSAQDEKKSTAAPSRPAPPPQTIPAGAVETSPGTYSYTDAQGKKWTYRKTPFGVAKFEEQAGTGKPDEAADLKKSAATISAVEDGDYIRFERPSPFGTYKWRQKKTELGPLEKAAWDRAREKQSAEKTPAREKE